MGQPDKFMKKIRKQSLFLLLLFLFFLTGFTTAFSGCSSANPSPSKKEDPNPDSSSTEPTPEETNYVFYCRSPKDQEMILLYPGMEPTTVLEQLGDPLSYYEAPSCALDGMDQIYTYSGYELTVSAADTNILMMIRLTDDSFTTAEGIYIGSTTTELVTSYGEVEPVSGEYRYPKGKMELAFLTKNQVVTSIEYRYLP